MSDWKGRTAVVTGAASGIGAAISLAAAARGMNVVLADLNEDEMAAVASDIPNGAALIVRTDVADAASVDALAGLSWARFGRVDLLCNNAGVVPGGRHRPVWEHALEDWRWAFGVNVFGIANGIRSFIPRMLAQGTPAHVLNTASVASFVSGAGSAVYGASKHAVARITEALYAELMQSGAPIGVTMLCPGLVATRICDAERSRPPHLRHAGIGKEAPELAAIVEDLYRGTPSLEAVAEMAFEGIEAGKLYVFTTDRFDPVIRARAEAILARSNPDFTNVFNLSRTEAADAGTRP